jgi:molecular chaperone DnaK
MREAESHAEEDKKRRADIETKNRADQAVYTAERMLRDTGERVASDDKTAIEAAIADVKKAIESDDVEAINRSVQTLVSAQHKAAESLYRQQSSGGAGGGTPPPGGGGGGSAPGGDRPGGDVIDAEVVDEEKK